MDLLTALKQATSCEITDDMSLRKKYSRDASVFEMIPQIIAIPKNAKEISEIVNFVRENKNKYKGLSVSVRAGGTCMSGGSLTESILIQTDKLNKIKHIGEDYAVVEPGLYYRDLAAALDERNLKYPPFPSSWKLCTVGGIVANNAGGEMTLQYGKTENFVNGLKVILEDGNEYEVKKLNMGELNRKMEQDDFEGSLYKKLFNLFDKNSELIKSSEPKVTKNSTGYNIWKVWDGEYFDIPRLFTGSQGTLGIITEINFRLVPKKKYSGLVVVFLKDYDKVPLLVRLIQQYKPMSFESFDHHTTKLALKYFYAFGKTLKTNLFKTTKLFLPDLISAFEGKIPKLTLMIQFESDEKKEINESIEKLTKDLSVIKDINFKICKNKKDSEKYWAIRHDSFKLQKERLTKLYAAPCIDDTIVPIDVLPQFFQELYLILEQEKFLYTVAGHIGNGNFHIFPLLDMTNRNDRNKIWITNDRVFKLTWKYNGVISAEHNDGLIRAPYLEMQYGEKIYRLFEDIKNIFDPNGILNPRKKVGVTKEYAQQFVIHERTTLNAAYSSQTLSK